jgi:hypothetical protein
MTDSSPAWLAPFRLILRVVLSILLILWTLLDSILSPIFRPLLDWLSSLKLFEWIGGLLGRLPPYVALAVFAVPFIVIEPFKAFALYWLGIGHVFQGGALYVLAHLASILIVERIYHAAHEPLMRIGWFKRLMTWLDGLRRLVLDWARSTAIWQWSTGLARQVKLAIRQAMRSARN